MREDHNITSRDKMMLTSAGVVSSESRIVGESHSANIGVNELLGWTLLLQRAICLETGGGDTHYHEAQRRGWGVHCSVFPQCTLLQHGTVWMLPQLPGILTLTSCWPVNIDLGAQFVLGPHHNTYIAWLQLNIISHDDLEPVTCSNHQQLSSSVTAFRPRLCCLISSSHWWGQMLHNW